MRTILSISVCLLTFCMSNILVSTQAITVVPVADLLLQKAKTVYPEKTTEESYQSFSLEGAKKSARSCPRVHQLLFNEQVTVVRQEGDELLVAIPNVFFEKNGKKYNRYWAHKKNFAFLKTLGKKGFFPAVFPKPITTDQRKNKKNTSITLLLPFQDKKRKRIFSSGTRFVKAKTNNKNAKLIDVFALNPSLSSVDIISIPKQLCCINVPQSKKEQRKQFVKLLKKWAHRPDGFIPYVWGGCSFTRSYDNKMIRSSIMALKSGRKIPVFWQHKKLKIATGFDCAGAVMRAAQIFGIPYFFKNSFTALKNLEKISSYDDLKTGDLLYISGHIMLVSDKKRNKVIEARSHWHGFGRFHEIPLERIFQGIKTYQQLFAESKKGNILHRLNSTGNAFEEIKNIIFLKTPT